MRKLTVETITTLVLTSFLVSAMLAILPSDTMFGEGEQTWWGRLVALLSTTFRLDFPPLPAFGSGRFLEFLWKASMRSLVIVGGTTLALLTVALPLGILSVVRPQSRGVQGARRAAEMVSNMPVLFWCTLFAVLIIRGLGISADYGQNPIVALFAAIAALFLGDRLLADVTRRVEIGTREVLDEPYMRTVQASGFGVMRHLVQSLVPPVADAIAARAMFLVGGAIVIERILNIQGLGYTVLEALQQDDGRPLEIVLAATMALACIGLTVRISAQSAVMLADGRRRG